VRAHHWVVMGDLGPGRPWMYLPLAARLYCRQKPWPPGDTCRTKTALAVELLRHADAESIAPILALCDGAYAMATVVRPCLEPEAGQQRIALITRLRADACLHQPGVSRPRPPGRPATWSKRLPAPPHHLYWPTVWQSSQAWVYGRLRRFQYQQLRCRWAVSGPQLPVHVLVVQRAGDEEPWFLVTATLDLSAAQVVAVFTARFRQEDALRDHKQRLGMEECRAWTKEPILPPFQVQLVALMLLRLLHAHIDNTWGAGHWWLKPEWNARKCHASILDLRRLFWRYRTEFSQFLGGLEAWENIPQNPGLRRNLAGRAA
jgi:hypothetical protein